MIVLSRELTAIAINLRQGRRMVPSELIETGEFIASLAKLALNVEHELAVHRLTEAGQAGRAMVEQLAKEQLEKLVLDPEGKVIHANFGGKS